jgi:hypothetical protein
MKQCQRILQPTVPNMKKILFSIMVSLQALGGLRAESINASPKTEAHAGTAEKALGTSDGRGLSFPRIDYNAKVSEGEARVVAEVVVESNAKDQTGQTLFEGELAMLPPKLPAPLRIERSGNSYTLLVSKQGRYEFAVELMAKVKDAEPWNQISFTGPAAAIASVTAQAAGKDTELQLLTGTPTASARSNGVTQVKGFLGGERNVALRWSRNGPSGAVARKAVVTADTSVHAQITPTVIRYVTQVRYDILQGNVSKLILSLPASHTLTRLVGEQVRDWEINQAPAPGEQPADGHQQLLEIQFIKPIEHHYELSIYSEQTVESMPSSTRLSPPQPMEIEREAGSFTLATEDTAADVESAEGLRQVNAPTGALAAYRFNGRPFTLALKLRRIEPELTVVERVNGAIEETRLVSEHALTLNVEKAGVYGLDLLVPAGFSVSEVRGAGVEDWKLAEAGVEGGKKLRVNFATRVLGERKLEVVLEEPFKTFPERITLEPLRIAGAARESSEIGAAAAAGIRVKTSELTGLREVPVRTLRGHAKEADELLGYKAEQPDWKLTLATERLAPRIVADVFNLVTIGDGIVGGSATIRYGLMNQGVQQFDLAVPATWKNVEFTGPNIRRKELKKDGTWTIGLQDKVWGGYTLVVTYDYQFDPKGATLAIGGLHTVGVERETGSVAVTTAASLKLNPKDVSDSLRQVDELELSEPNRALITHSVVLAYQYEESQYHLNVEVQRFEEASVLSAVADRTQLTTVLTDAGEMLTQASFMVKNNDKQFQRFELPKGAKFWSCHVNGQPVKAERDGDWLMAPLPRGANRNQAFAVDIVYAQTNGIKPAFWPRAFALQAPQTDVPNTYAEWQLYAPATYRLSGLGGNMTPVRGTTYDIQDAWQKFTRFYWVFLHESGPALLMILTLAGLVVALIGSAIRRGSSGVISVLAFFVIMAILAGMLLPALSRAKSRSQRINGINNLKQIGLAARTFALDNTNRLPNSFEEMMNELSTDKITYDPETGQRYTYVGAGFDLEKIHPESVIAFSPPNNRNYRDALLADGSVQQFTSEKFEELERRGFILLATPQQAAQNQQLAAVRGAQFQSATGMETPAAGQNGQPAMAGPRMRSIQIDIPREGQTFTFTKVLQLDKQALVLKAKVMKLQTFQTAQMCLQLTAFLSGLLIWWRQWRTRRNSFVLTLALALALGAVGSLLLAWRLLHLAFIWLAPILLLAGLGWLTWKFWPRPSGGASASEARLTPGLPPAVAALALLGLSLAVSSASPAARDGQSAAILSSKHVSIVSALYTVAVTDQVAQVEVTIAVTTSEPNQKVFLFGDDVAVQQCSSKPAEARLVREANGVAAVLPRRGETTLQLKLLVKLGGDVTKRQLAFSIPGALTSHWDLTIDQSDADVEFPVAIWVRRSTAGQQTHVEAMMGSGEQVQVLWTPRVKRSAEIAANVICHSSTLLTFGNGVLNAQATLDYQVTQGEMRQARVRLPAGHRLLRVEGETIRTWELKSENGEQVVQVELLKGMAPGYRLTIETEKLLGTLPADVIAEIPHAIGVNRELGVVALRGDEELELVVQNAAELYRVDIDEFARSAGHKAEGVLNAFRFLKPDFKLQVHVAPMRPQIEAVLHNQVRVSPESVSLTGIVDYTIKRAGVFGLKLGLPEGFRLESVSGTNILQTAERTGAAGLRFLEITLKERTTGSYSLRLELSQTLKQLPPTLTVAGVHPLELQKLEGLILVSVEPGVAVKPSAFEGLTEIPAASLGTNDGSAAVGSLAFKFMATEPQAEPPWKLAVQTESVESWVRAEFVTTLTLSDTMINGRARARFDIQNAPIKELHLNIPAAFKNVEISAPNIRRRDHAGENWTVEFQSKIRGPHMLTIAWEQPRPAKTNYLELVGVSAGAVERETGVLAIVARAPLQVTEKNAADLKPIDLRDLPDWAGQPDEGTVLAYRYLRPGYKLGVEARRFAEAEVLQALVESLNLSTVLADDGQMMTEMSLSVRNRGRQHLEITLPDGATVWSAFVAGQPVRPSLNGTKLLLPLEHSVGDDSAIPIDLVYVDTRVFPQKRGAVELISPKLDAPLKSARWELFLPPDYSYSDFGGTMAHEVETATVEASGFSFLDYSSRESTSKAQLAKELKSELSSAQQKLSSGNVKAAMTDFNRARSKSDLAVANNSEARQIEAELRRAQGNNLIEAQNAFSRRYGLASAQPSPVASESQAVQYDNASAEAQWTKLQQAQDLAIAAVQPIHVNLPTRGLRHAFTQVLQTETGRPLTVRLFAANTRASTWPKRIAGPLTGFLALWVVVWLLAHHSRQAKA